MKGYEQTCPKVEAIGQINFHGDGVFTPNNWYHNICHKNGKPYLEAIILLADIVSWYLPIYERDEVTGKTIGVRKKFKADKLQRNYDSFADHYGMTKDQARNALKHLERDGLIDLELRTVETSVQKLGNVLFIGVYPEKIKDYTFTLSPKEQTPVLTETDRGIDRKAEGSAQKQTALPTEAQTNTDQSTDLSTDQSTKNIRADEFFAIAPSSQIQENSFPAQTENPRIEETPTPPTPSSPSAPENIGKAIAPSVATSKQAEAYMQFEQRFSQPKPQNRHVPKLLVEAGYAEWHNGKHPNDWRKSLIDVCIQRKKKRGDEATVGAATDFIFNVMKDCISLGFWGKFQELVDQALKLEAVEAIAAQQKQIEDQRFEQQPVESNAPTMTLELRKQYAAELRRKANNMRLIA